MKQLCSKIYRKNRGFSMVELMVVTAIMGVLSGISVPSYQYINSHSRESSTEKDMLGIVQALELNQNYNDMYPSTGEGLVKLEDNKILKNVKGTDYWGNNYKYTSDTISYTLTSSGRDKKFDTDDDIVFENGFMISDGRHPNNGGRGTKETVTTIILKNSKDITDKVFEIFDDNKDKNNFYKHKTEYNLGSWSGILQHTLQEGSIENEISNSDENAFGYINPSSGNKNIVNYNKKLKKKLNNYRPAVLITKNKKYSYNEIDNYAKFKDAVVGTVIVYKANNSTSAEIYYIDEHGNKSGFELIG